MSLSPRTNQMMMQQPGMAPDENQLFEQGFTQAAEGMLMNKIPEIADQIVSFKVIKSDIETGSAVGAFILDMTGDSIFIPVVLLENELKPIEVMYVRNSGSFLPLTPEWIHEANKNHVEPMGEGVQRPDTLMSDVDISRLVRPPYEGRFSFASAKSPLSLVDFLNSAASNQSKVKLASVFEQNPDLLRAAVTIYGDTLIAAMQPKQTKVASDKDLPVYIATRASPKEEVRARFGANAAFAMHKIANQGYAILDNRTATKVAVDVEHELRMQEIKDSGAYELMKTDGKLVKALVIQTPIDVFNSRNCTPAYGKPVNTGVRKVINKSWRGVENYDENVFDASSSMVLTDDGYCGKVHKQLIGRILTEDELGDVSKLRSVFEDEVSAPKKGWGVFVRRRGMAYEATCPMYIHSVSTGSDGVRRIMYDRHEPDKLSKGATYTMVTDPDANVRSLRVPAQASIRYIPSEFTWIPCDSNRWKLEGELVYDPNVCTSMIHKALVKTGSERLTVHSKGDGFLYTPGDNEGRGKVATLVKLVYRHGLSEGDASRVIKVAQDNGRCSVFTVAPRQMFKLAMSGAMPPAQQGQQQPVPQQPPAPQAPVDPNAMPQDPAAMGQMDPNAMMPAEPMPSPTDIAIQEVKEKVMREFEAQQALMEQHMQSLQTQLEALEAVGARTEEVAQGVPKEESAALVAEGPAASEQEVGPEMMQDASQMYDPAMFDTAAITSLAESATLTDAVATYLPTLMKGLDHIGRILMTFWMKGPDLRGELGDEKFNAVEDKLRNLFKSLGDLLLDIQQNALVVRPGDDLVTELTE